MVDIFNRDMLRLARNARGLTQSETAGASGVTQAAISKIENGLEMPSQEMIAAISCALRFPPEFFSQETKVHGLPQYHYRKRARLGVRILQKIEADTNIQRIHIATLAKSFEGLPEDLLPSINLDLKQRSPQDAARQMRGYWMVPRGPINNLVGIVEDAGVVVVPLDFGTPTLDAISFRHPGLSPLVFINRAVPGDRFRFTLAHELGHLILHNRPLDDDDMEDEADKFAAEFLMPAAEVRPYLKNPTMSQLARVKGYWKVSIKALIYNAHALKLITPSQYRNLNINYSRAGYNRGEPFPIEVETPQTLPRMVSHHLEVLDYTVDEMAGLLMLEPEEFQDRYTERPRLRVVK